MQFVEVGTPALSSRALGSGHIWDLATIWDQAPRTEEIWDHATIWDKAPRTEEIWDHATIWDQMSLAGAAA